jgi:hypothetical protein
VCLCPCCPTRVKDYEMGSVDGVHVCVCVCVCLARCGGTAEVILVGATDCSTSHRQKTSSFPSNVY